MSFTNGNTPFLISARANPPHNYYFLG
jgi:hypothetical protein